MLGRVIVRLMPLKVVTLLTALLLIGASAQGFWSYFLNADIFEITGRLRYKIVLLASRVLDKLVNLDGLVIRFVRRIVDFLTSIMRIMQAFAERCVDQ